MKWAKRVTIIEELVAKSEEKYALIRSQLWPVMMQALEAKKSGVSGTCVTCKTPIPHVEWHAAVVFHEKGYLRTWPSCCQCETDGATSTK